jgi:transposase
VDTEIGVLWNRRWDMERRRFTREFKLEAVKLVTERGVAIAQAARDLEVSGPVLRGWVKELEADQQQAFLGHGQQRADQVEITRLRREVAKLKARAGHSKKTAAYFVKDNLRSSFSLRSTGGYLDGRRLALCCRRDRSLLPPCRRLVDERDHDRRARRPCPGDIERFSITANVGTRRSAT